MLLLAMVKPLPENNNSATGNASNESENGWQEWIYGLSPIVGFVIGYLALTLIYIRWPNLWPNNK